MSILSVDQFRSLAETGLEDAALQILLDAAEEAIVASAGSPSSVVEVVNGGGAFISLARPAASITSITETDSGEVVTTLAANDYQLYPGGLVVRRSILGANSRRSWHGRVTVTYAPADDASERQRVQYQLVQLDLNYAPGTTAEQIGAWMEQHQQSSVWNYRLERDAILASLGVGHRPGMVVVGG